MPFDPSTAQPIDQPRKPGGKAFDPTTARPVSAGAPSVNAGMFGGSVANLPPQGNPADLYRTAQSAVGGAIGSAINRESQGAVPEATATAGIAPTAPSRVGFAKPPVQWSEEAERSLYEQRSALSDKLLKAGKRPSQDAEYGRLSKDLADIRQARMAEGAMMGLPVEGEGIARGIGAAARRGSERGYLAGVKDASTASSAGASSAASRRLADFEKSGITPSAPTVFQNKSMGTVASALGQVPIVGEPVTRRVLGNVAEAGASSERLAGQYGKGTDPFEAGEALKGAYQQFKEGKAGEGNISLEQAVTQPTRNVGFIPKSEALYDGIPIKPEAPAIVSNTMARLKDLAMRFKSNPDLSEAMASPAFQKFNDALEKGGLSWEDLRRLRTDVGQKMRDPAGQLGLGRDDWRALYGAISEDIKATAQRAGPDAAKAFDRANNYYRAGLERLNDVMGFIDKADHPEKAYYSLTRMASERGQGADIGRLERTMRSLPSEARGDVAATVINRLGLATKAQAGRNPASFSIGTWASNYADLSERAKDALFGIEGTARRDSLDALARSMNSIKNVERLGNPSGTARTGWALGELSALWTAPHIAIPAGSAGFSLSTALMSPRLVRWLAEAPKIAIEDRPAFLKKLNDIADDLKKHAVTGHEEDHLDPPIRWPFAMSAAAQMGLRPSPINPVGQGAAGP